MKQGSRGTHFFDFCEDYRTCPFTVVVFSSDLKQVGDVRRIAENALSRIYGRKVIESERPFTATLTNGVWHVVGSVNCGDQHGSAKSVPCAGGAAMADTKQSSGRILKTGHTE